MSAGYVLELLDEEEHQALHSWPLGDEDEITVGRSPACNVVLGNRFVSRLHARLKYANGGWTLFTESEQGVWLDGRMIDEAPLGVGGVFRLGGLGPSLRIGQPVDRGVDTESTIRLRPGELQLLYLDTEVRDREVEQIAGSDFFQDLGAPGNDPRILSIHSFRGGTGKSNTTANLASRLVARGLRVAVIDTDIQSPGLHVLFGVSPDTIRYALNDYLWGRARIEDAAIDVTAAVTGDDGGGTGRLFLVPSAIDSGEIARVLKEGYDVGLLSEGYRQLIETLELDYLLIDTHPGVNEETLLSIALSDIFLLILRPDNQDFQGSAVTMELARRLGVRRVMVALNKVPPRVDKSMLVQQVEKAYAAPVAALLPLSNDVARAASGSVFCVLHPEHPFAIGIEGLAQRIVDGTRA